MSDRLAASYRLCRRMSRRSASNFLLTFWFLPRAKRRAMYALYAFFRHTDDLADGGGSAEQRQAELEQWRLQLGEALSESSGEQLDPRLPAVVDTLRTYEIDPEYLFESIRGVESDLRFSPFQTVDQLRHYCYQVAGTIGLSCLPVWGVQPGFNPDDAVAAGFGLQLTNILRDIREDANRQRVYLPREDLVRFGVDEQRLLSGQADDRLIPLMQTQVDRAKQALSQSQRLLEVLSPEGRHIFSAMLRIYGSLLEQIEKDPLIVWQRRVRVGRWRKLRVLTTLAVSRWRAPVVPAVAEIPR